MRSQNQASFLPSSSQRSKRPLLFAAASGQQQFPPPQTAAAGLVQQAQTMAFSSEPAHHSAIYTSSPFPVPHINNHNTNHSIPSLAEEKKEHGPAGLENTPPAADRPHHQHHHHSRHDSKVSIDTQNSAKSQQQLQQQREAHKHYLDSLPIPTHEMTARIAEAQEHNEEEILRRRAAEGQEVANLNGTTQNTHQNGAQAFSALDYAEREKATRLIQRNYRGHRERRMLAGMSLDPSSRWVEAVKEARYRQLTLPRARGDLLVPPGSAGAGGEGEGDGEDRPGHRRMTSAARMNWKKIGVITRRAGGDEESDEEESGDERNLTNEEREALKRKRAEKKMVRQKAAKIMDLQYFLEMVDLKHRYGSNLRTYHEQWKASDTTENFFYWLDYGEGKYIDIAACPRERLDKEQVRYLSKEDRLNYLVEFDKDGRLCWAKNGARINTTTRFKDSIHGVVPETDETPAYRPPSGEAARHIHNHGRKPSQSSTATSSSSSSESEAEDDRADRYANPELDNAKGVKKIKHVSAATIFNKLLRGSVKKNTWIFVADTSFRLYVGIKQSGAFQHSSFLHGSRISAAGTIKIKNGRLAKLSPLSGHYRPPVSNFKAFVHSMKEEGVDMSHVSISRSYAVLVGLEAYVKTRRRGKRFLQKLVYHRDKLLSPVEVAEKEEAERDKTESAAKEKRFLEEKEREREEESTAYKLKEKLHITHTNSTLERERQHPTGETKSWEKDPDIQKAGTGPENAIAPEGHRD